MSMQACCCWESFISTEVPTQIWPSLFWEHSGADRAGRRGCHTSPRGTACTQVLSRGASWGTRHGWNHLISSCCPHTHGEPNVQRLLAVSCSVLHRGWDKKLKVVSVFHHLQTKIPRALRGLWAIRCWAALSFPTIFFHSWVAFKTLLGASQHWKIWREGQKWCELVVVVLIEQECCQPRAGSLGSGSAANPLLIHTVNYLVVWSQLQH